MNLNQKMTYRIPYHHVIFYCDKIATISALTNSYIKNQLNVSDVVKGFAKRTTIQNILHIPTMFRDLFIKYNQVVTENNQTNFFWACKEGQLDVVKYLVSLKTDITAFDNRAVTEASEYGHLETVKYLVSVSADVTANHNRPLARSSANGHLDTVKYLVSVGADVTDNYFETALQRASENGHLDVVKYLVSAGSDVRDYHDDAIRSAVCENHLEVVKFLITVGGGNIFIDSSLLDIAISKGRLDIVKYLISIGCASSNGSVKIAVSNGHFDIVRFLIETGVDIMEVRNSQLLGAIKGNDIETVKYVVSKGALVKRTDVHYASRLGHLDIVEFLFSIATVH